MAYSGKEEYGLNVKDMTKISVVVPVYGTEKYLNKCVESIVNQTYKNLEIILVDDGSPDNCPQMCDEWASRDLRIKTVHRLNGGLSCARNTGLSMATGDYITFVDSDDWIAPDTYEYALGLFAMYGGTDAVQYNLRQTSDENVYVKTRPEVIEVYRGKDILQYFMTATTITGSYSMCRCLFRTSIIKHYRFREGKINEDIDYKYKVLRDCNVFVVSNQVKYFYRQAGSSISSGILKARDFQLYEAAEELYKLTQIETYGRIAFLGRVKKARTPFSLLGRIALWGMDESLDEECITKRLIKENRQNLPILLKSPMKISRKVLAVLFCISFPITKVFLRIAEKCRRSFYKV